ncbi:uncharacterized protein [Rutidosis leptorrhynchoides]|uniref:uncharacterized protein n=1 Tax=Rutidosis leptorrhynchoides TaxID=125765 RepID=UPI003A99C9DE
MLATDNFASTYCISSHRDDMLYEADINHVDINSFFTTEGKNRGENIKVCGPVTIKRNISKNYEQVAKEFIAEIKMLAGREHPNILSLFGFSLEGYEMILIFESCTLYKSLADHLGSISEKTNLMQRIRICLDIAQGLDYFHNIMDAVGPVRIHQGMLSTNVMLDENWNAKIATFRLYPEYIRHPRETEIYSFGVVIFEILCGRLAFDPYNTRGNSMELVRITQSCFEEGTFQSMVDPNIMKEVREDSYMIAPFRRSLNALKLTTYRCLFEYSIILPVTLKHIINYLNRALRFREETLERLKIQLSDIKAATKDFTETYIGEGGYGVVYRTELDVFDKKRHSIQKRTVAIKRDPRKESELGNRGFVAELEIIFRCEHPNIISLLGFCFEDSENILVFEYAANGSLDDYVKKGKLNKLPWARRLKMCLDIAYGLSYLHTSDDDKTCIIHRDIKSGNILLGENLEVKIADFGLSIFHPKIRPSRTIKTEHCAGTHVYLDPEYQEGKLKIESDIYSFGVVLFEILSGKLAYDRIYTKENGNGIAPVARQRFKDRKLMEMVDITILEEAHELSTTIIIGPSQDSLNEFFKIACKCVAEAQADRPKMEEVINGLKRAINLQKNRKDTLEISLEDISLGEENLSNTSFNIEKGYGMYNGQVQYDDETKPVIIKRMRKSGLETPGSWREFEIPFKHKHENVIGLVGYFKKMNENFIVYENAINQSLDMHLGNATLTWIKRLKIGVDIANGLKFLHGSDEGQEDVVIIHRDLKSCNILLTGDWKAKVCGFYVSIIYPNNHNIHYAADGIESSPGYCDPSYSKTCILTKKSDIYSLGVILFELLCGRLACTDQGHFLDSFVKGQYEVERPDKLVFERIREQIVWKSLVTFTTIAFSCLHDDRNKRPTASEVAVQLQQALELQEGQEIWDTKLPRNYNEILKLSNTPERYSTMEKKDIYNILSRGIPLQKGKLWYSIGGDGERNEMISSRMFSYKNRWSHRWRSIKESRFEKVAELLDISNLNIEIKMSSQLLLPGVNYSVRLVFKFCCPRKSLAKRMYVNLKYTIDNEKLNAYFATWREDGWMMIELCRFSNHKNETVIEVLLKSFSRCYCDSRAIYIEGIVFQAIDDVKREETQHVLEFKSEMDKVQQLPTNGTSKVIQEIEKCDEIQQPILKPNSEMSKFPATDMASMRQEVLAKKWILYDYSNVKLVYSNSSSRTRFEGMELLRRQSAYSIKWKIGSQKVSPNKDHACYLLFKLSENCRGLYCPVLVRNQERWKSKETIYFRHPSPWNVHETDRVPKERSDGWMEVIVWIYNNSNCKLRNDSLHVKLKLTTYEGTLSGLILGGLEFRPIEE